MFRSLNIIDFYKDCNDKLKEIMASQESKFFQYDFKTNYLTKLDSLTNTLQKIPAISGLIQLCIEKRQTLEVLEPFKHDWYNPQLDIMTNLCLLTVPVIDHESKKVIAVFQIINIVNNVERNYGKINWIDSEVIDFLCKIIEICLKKLEK